MSQNGQFIEFGPYYSGGLLVSGFKIYHYLPGTTTLKNVWTDRGKTTTAAQPLVADANGKASCYADGLYKFVVKDASDVTLYTFDNVAVRDELGLVFRAEDYADFPTAVAAIGTTQAVLRWNETQTVASNVTVPRTLRLWPVYPGTLSINAGITVTMTTPDQIIATDTQPIVSGSGTLAFLEGGRISAKWLGAKGDTLEFSGAATIGAASSSLTVTGGHFTSADVGKSCIVFGAGAVTAAPSAPTVALVATGTGNVDNGTHSYKLVAWTWYGMSLPSAASAQLTNDGTHKQSTVTVPTPVFPIHSYGVYRTIAGDTGSYLLVGQSFGGTFTDNAADAYLGGAAPSSDGSAAPLVTTIATVTGATTCTLANAATTAVTNGRMNYGTNDTAALIACGPCMLDGGTLAFPAGRYWFQPTANDDAAQAIIVNASNASVLGVGDDSILYMPTIPTCNHANKAIGILWIGKLGSYSNVQVRDLHILGETPNGLMPGNTVPLAAVTPYCGVFIGTYLNTTDLIHSSMVSNVTFEKMPWNSVIFNNGTNVHPAGAARGNVVERCRILNCNNGELNTLSGGSLKTCFRHNYFDGLGNMAMECASHTDILSNTGRNIGSAWLSTDTVTTQEGWMKVFGNNFYDVGRFNGSTTVTSAIGIGQTQAQTKMHIFNNVIQKAAGYGIYSPENNNVDLIIEDNVIDEFGVGAASHYFGTLGTVGVDGINLINSTRVLIRRNWVRAGSSVGDASRYAIQAGGGTSTDSYTEDNGAIGTFTGSSPYYFVTSLFASGGTRTYARNNLYNNGTAWIMYQNGNVSGVPTVAQFADGAATPSIAGSDSWYTVNSAPTTITNFADPSYDQLLTVTFGDSNTTIAYNQNLIYLTNGQTATFLTGDTITFRYSRNAGGFRWVEVARTRMSSYYATGTATVASGATSVVVTHNLAKTPTPSQITITPTNLPTNPPGHWYVDTITSTQFTLHVTADPGASGAAFSWAGQVLP